MKSRHCNFVNKILHGLPSCAGILGACLKCSLRRKILVLVTVAIALTALPGGFIAYNTVLDDSVRHERQLVENILLFIEESLSLQQSSLLRTQSQNLTNARAALHEELLLLRGMVNAHQQEAESSPPLWLAPVEAQLRSRNFFFDVYDAQHGFLFGRRPFAELLGKRPLFNFLGMDSKTLLDEEALPAVGHFAIFRDEGDVDAGSPREGMPAGGNTLLHFLPWPEQGRVLCLGMPVEDFTLEDSRNRLLLAAAMQERLRALSLSDRTSIQIFSATGDLLVSRGALPDEQLSQLRMEANFKPLNWRVVVSTPRHVVEAPARDLAGGMMLLFLACAVGCLLLSLYLSLRIVRPLSLLTEKMRQYVRRRLPALPMQKTAPSSGTRRRLWEEGDEVRQLFSAFTLMDASLHAHVTELVKVTAVRERMSGELQAAWEIQSAILPPADTAQAWPHITVSTYLEPAKEVGGDLYDLLTAPDGRRVLVIGDVSGKGVPASLFMAMIVTLVRYAVREGWGPAECLSRINEHLAENNVESMFASLFVGFYTAESGDMEYVNGGHCRPLLLERDGTVRRLEPLSGPYVGAFAGAVYRAHHAHLAAGACCLLYTDGVTEAMRPDGTLFGEAALQRLLGGLPAEPASIVAAVCAAVHAFREDGAQDDDVTLLCFRHDASASEAESVGLRPSHPQTAQNSTGPVRNSAENGGEMPC